jgi:hypothetical protein
VHEQSCAGIENRRQTKRDMLSCPSSPFGASNLFEYAPGNERAERYIVLLRKTNFSIHGFSDDCWHYTLFYARRDKHSRPSSAECTIVLSKLTAGKPQIQSCTWIAPSRHPSLSHNGYLWKQNWAANLNGSPCLRQCTKRRAYTVVPAAFVPRDIFPGPISPIDMHMHAQRRSH